MYKIPITELKAKIVASKKVTEKELENKIKSKINELSGLISEEGAAHIIANELGVDLSVPQSRLKIKEVHPGMRNVTTIVKLIRKFEMREFVKGESKGKVCSIIVGDETATIRVVFWNDQVDLLSKVNDGDVLLIKEAYARDNKGSLEIHLGDKGELVINPEGEKVEAIKQNIVYNRKKIESLQANEDGAEILGTVVQVFDPRFFNVCPECSKKVNEIEGKFNCDTHGSVVPVVSYVLNLVLDDGSGNIRGVFWKNQVNHLLNKTETEVTSFKDDISKFEDFKNELLGEQLLLTGRIRKNDMFDRLEFNVQMVERAKVEVEIERMQKVEEVH